MGSSKDHFCNLRVSLPGSQKYIREYLRKQNICQKYFVIAQGPRYYRFMQKTRHQKSHASVPLNKTKSQEEIWKKMYRCLIYCTCLILLRSSIPLVGTLKHVDSDLKRLCHQILKIIWSFVWPLKNTHLCNTYTHLTS